MNSPRPVVSAGPDRVLVIDALPDSGQGLQSGMVDPGLLSPRLLSLTAAVWLGSFMLSTLRDLADPPTAFGLITLLRVIFAFIGAALCLPLHWLLLATRRYSFIVQIASALPALILCAILYCEATFAVQAWIASPGPDYGASWRFYNTVYWGMFFLAWTALYLALRSNAEMVEQVRHGRMLESLAHEAQLRALRYQVDPHFLFNALNSVSALVVMNRVQDAENMITRLSRFFRQTLIADPNAEITLREEVDLQRAYLEIEQVRFPDFTIDIAIPGELEPALVPALILQPIVENAVKFGVATTDGPTRIAISAHRDHSTLIVVVRDQGGTTVAAPGTGIGLANVEARLVTRYGPTARLHGRFDSGSDGRPSFVVEIALPLTFAR
jgi:two-component system LytT family sensor kinase